MTTTHGTRAEEVAEQLKDLVRQAQTEPVPLPAGEDDLVLREVGLSSLDMVTFLVLIEDTFGITLDDDLPEETLRTVGSIAAFLVGIGA